MKTAGIGYGIMPENKVAKIEKNCEAIEGFI